MAKEKRIDVMLSSTSKDLPEHREQATNGILRVGMHPIIMEALTATPRDPIADSLKLVDEAEVYIGIFAMRYGHIPDDPRNPDGISITEMEYRHAMKTGKVVLIFMMSDDHPLPSSVKELRDFQEQTAEGKKKLEALTQELRDKHTVGFFDSPDDLRGHVMQALEDEEVIARAREIAGVEDDDEAVVPPSPLPLPPEFYADPPYTLTTEFIGRSDELQRLDAWAVSDDPLMLVEAIGGMGKSAVTWQWVQQHALKKRDYDGVMWWSFYESGATMAAFVRHALAYLTRQDPETLKGRDLRENFRLLRLELAKGRYLLVLDGLERVLVAYHRWNAAQMRDDKIEDAESIIRDRDIRACTDPRDDEVMTGLLTCDKTKILISTRLLPLALEDRAGNRSKGVAHIHLNGLHPDDALALARHAGVKVDNVPQFHLFTKTFGNHSLLVKLVAGRINKFRRARGDFDAWYAAEGRQMTVSDFTDDLKQNQTHILKYALEDLQPEAMRFLSQIAAFGDAVTYDVLAVFNPYVQPKPNKVQEVSQEIIDSFVAEADNDEDRQRRQEIVDNYLGAYEDSLKEQEAYDTYLKSPEYRKGLTQFDGLLSELEERGLLRWDREKDLYDMHPVVRGTAFDRLEGEARVTTFERIRGHFEQQTEDVESAQEVADLSNTIGVYRALVGAGKVNEAASFFRNRLEEKLHYNIAAYYTVIELLTPLFPDGTDTLPRLSDPDDQSSVTTTMAAMFSYIGRNDESLALQGLMLKLDLDNDASANLGVGLRNISGSLRDANQLALVLRTLEAALALAQATKNTKQITMSTLFLLDIYKDIGQWDEAESAYAFLQANPPREVFWQAAVEHWYAETLIHRGLDANAALDRAETLAQQGNNALGYRQIKGLRGEVALAQGDYAAAIRWFEEYIQLSRKAGSGGDIYAALGGLARAYALKGEHDRAREIADQGIGSINVAEVYLAIGDYDKAREYAIRAYKWAWSDGPPYVFWWYLERAKKVLDALGEPYPEMPPFNPDKIGKYPYQDEVEAYIARKRGGHAEEGEG